MRRPQPRHAPALLVDHQHRALRQCVPQICHKFSKLHRVLNIPPEQNHAARPVLLKQSPLLGQKHRPRNPQNNRLQDPTTMHSAPPATACAQNACASCDVAKPLSRTRQIFCPSTTGGDDLRLLTPQQAGQFALQRLPGRLRARLIHRRRELHLDGPGLWRRPSRTPPAQATAGEPAQASRSNPHARRLIQLRDIGCRRRRGKLRRPGGSAGHDLLVRFRHYEPARIGRCDSQAAPAAAESPAAAQSRRRARRSTAAPPQSRIAETPPAPSTMRRIAGSTGRPDRLEL